MKLTTPPKVLAAASSYNSVVAAKSKFQGSSIIRGTLFWYVANKEFLDLWLSLKAILPEDRKGETNHEDKIKK